MGAHMLCFRKKYDPDICHFLIVLHDQCHPAGDVLWVFVEPVNVVP